MDKSQPLLLALLAKQELDKLCPSLTPLEIDSLAAAASQLTGIEDNDSFDSVVDFVGFMKDKAAPEAAVYAEHLRNLGFRSFGAISHAFKLDAVSMELLVDETDLGGRRAVRAFAGRHVDLVGQEYALADEHSKAHARRRMSAMPPVPEPGNGDAAAPSAGPLDAALGSSRATESVDGTSASGEGRNLEKAAAELNRKWVFGVIGRGAMGAAYGVRLPDGSQWAVKVAPRGSEKEMQLRHEAKGYLTVRELWKAGVPEVLLAGPLLAIGVGYGIGTALVPGHPLQPGDQDLLPAARDILQRVHAKGVIHGDLREANFVVTQHGSTRDIYLIDFSHCSFTFDRSAQERKLEDLDDLFENL
ncbi:hypothetical protein WJX75_006159 [Coccomyxa subellipsoidea]|uniref:Non-specific serine/threonine protein kinase n=1 Tax=Coccomyxa subellipsoidea TaxID=248742 RepID=A0ABR2YBE8_9CHLO